VAEEQGALSAVFDATNRALSLQVVARVAASDAAPALTPGAHMDEDGIWAQVYDPATNTLRIVEVIV